MYENTTLHINNLLPHRMQQQKKPHLSVWFYGLGPVNENLTIIKRNLSDISQNSLAAHILRLPLPDGNRDDFVAVVFRHKKAAFTDVDTPVCE